MKIVFTLVLLINSFIFSNDRDDAVSEHIRKRVEDLSAGIKVDIQGQMFFCTKLLPEFYGQRSFEPAWSNEKNRREFISQLNKANEVGLSHLDYHYKVITDFSKRVRSPEEHAELDMLITDAYLLYASHLGSSSTVIICNTFYFNFGFTSVSKFSFFTLKKKCKNILVLFVD